VCESGKPTARRDTGIASAAPEAIRAAREVAATPPVGIGIDAPLFWAQAGDRRVDQIVRKRLVAAGGKTGTVSHVNSLRGACLVQGILTAKLAAADWPAAVVTETHPKALRRLSAAAEEFVMRHLRPGSSDHECDALLAAYTAWAAVTRQSGWRNIATERVISRIGGSKLL